MQARDIMTRHVVAVGLETSIPAIAELLIEHRISGVPVVDAQNHLLGIVTEGDLYRRVELGTEKNRGRWVGLLTLNSKLALDYVRANGRMAQDVMTRDVVHVSPDTPVSEIADLFEKHHIKRVPVVERHRLVGIVSRANLVQALAVYRPTSASTTETDRRIREDLTRSFAAQPWGKHAELNIVVSHGVVHLWGLVATEEARAALRVAAETTPGVKQVQDHTCIPVYN